MPLKNHLWHSLSTYTFTYSHSEGRTIRYKYILDNDIYDSYDPPTPTDPHNFQIYPNLHVIGITHSQYIPSIGDESGG